MSARPTPIRRSDRWLRLAVAVVTVVVALAIARVAWSARGDLPSLDEIRWQYAALSCSSMLGLVLTYAVCWWLLVDALDNRAHSGARFAPTVRLFLLTWPGRYFPAGLAHYGGRLIAGPRAGIARPVVAASLVYENLMVIGVGGALSLVLLIAGYRDRLGSNGWIIAAAGAIVLALAALHPAVVRTVIRIGSKRIRRLRALDGYVLPLRDVVRIAPAFALAVLFCGLSFYFAVLAVSPDDSLPLLLAIGAYNLAGIAGILAIGVPGGLGVREAVTVALVGAALSPPVALAAAVLTRLCGVVADVLPAIAIGLMAGVRRLRRRDVDEVEEPAAPEPALREAA